jgi:hypothetical protein
MRRPLWRRKPAGLFGDDDRSDFLLKVRFEVARFMICDGRWSRVARGCRKPDHPTGLDASTRIRSIEGWMLATSRARLKAREPDNEQSERLAAHGRLHTAARGILCLGRRASPGGADARCRRKILRGQVDWPFASVSVGWRATSWNAWTWVSQVGRPASLTDKPSSRRAR